MLVIQCNPRWTTTAMYLLDSGHDDGLVSRGLGADVVRAGHDRPVWGVHVAVGGSGILGEELEVGQVGFTDGGSWRRLFVLDRGLSWLHGRQAETTTNLVLAQTW